MDYLIVVKIVKYYELPLPLATTETGRVIKVGYRQHYIVSLLRQSMENISIALASLSGKADSAWATVGAPVADVAFIGGLALDKPTRYAAEQMANRGRDEFLPKNPFDWMRRELSRLSDIPITAGVNIRVANNDPVDRAAKICEQHDSIIEINAHCRQPEMCAVGSGEHLLRNPSVLQKRVSAAAGYDVPVSVKMRAEVSDVNLPEVASIATKAGADIIHVDAMDSEPIIKEIDYMTTDCLLIGNNGIKSGQDAMEYLQYGADAVSVARASDSVPILRDVKQTVEAYE